MVEKREKLYLQKVRKERHFREFGSVYGYLKEVAKLAQNRGYLDKE